MLKGDKFSRVFETQHGQLLIYITRFEDYATLHHLMCFDGWTYDCPESNSVQTITDLFLDYDLLQAEAYAMEASMSYNKHLECKKVFAFNPGNPDAWARRHFRDKAAAGEGARTQ